MSYASLAGKTVDHVTTCKLMGRNAYREWQSWTQVTLHFTDGTTESFAEDGSAVHDVVEVEYVSPAVLQTGDRMFDPETADVWHEVEGIRVDEPNANVYVDDFHEPWHVDALVARELRKPEPVASDHAAAPDPWTDHAALVAAASPF